jgi:hypothetical protein
MSFYIPERRLLSASMLWRMGHERAAGGDSHELMVCLLICGAMLGGRALQAHRWGQQRRKRHTIWARMGRMRTSIPRVA